MIFHIAMCSPDPVLRGRVQRHCLEYYARRADACIVEQLESAADLLRQEADGTRYELYLIELTASGPAEGCRVPRKLSASGRGGNRLSRRRPLRCRRVRPARLCV